MKKLSLGAFLLLLRLTPNLSEAKHKPSGSVKGRKPPWGYCNEDNNICCIKGKTYTTYKCSPEVSKTTKAVLNINGFEKGGDGYKPAKCDHKYHSDDVLVVAVSTGWYSGEQRCFKNITITGNGRSVVNAMVVDECNSSVWCDKASDYQPPCANNIIGASEPVWTALGVPVEDWGELDVTWLDAY